MRLLVRPKPYSDESLESYLLRLSQENGFERYSVFSGSIKSWLREQDHEAAGAFPLELCRVNVFHASRSSGLRVRALRLIEQLTDQSPSCLLQLALMHSAITFGREHKAVHRAGVDIPLGFIRTNPIPCCPECLRESGYIRQHWHYTPYGACHLHGGELIAHCPSCGGSLNYMQSDSLTHCRCGFDLRTATTAPANQEALQLASLAAGMSMQSNNPLFTTEHHSVRFGALLWFQQWKSRSPEGVGEASVLAGAMGFFASWPDSFRGELQQQVDLALLKQTKPFNHTAFSEVFGMLIADSRQLPMRDLGRNFILRTLFEYLTDLVVANPKTRVANLGDLLLSALEAAALLSTTVEQVYRLQQEGLLAMAIRPASRATLSPHAPAFRLRQVIEVRQSSMQSLHDASQTYLPAR